MNASTGNPFLDAARADRTQIGLFSSLVSPAAVEAIAHSGFDYVVFDAEHSPLAVPQLHLLLLALAAGRSEAVVRTASHDPAAVKHYLDLGVRTLMFPNVSDANEARALVRATRYPPAGFRGVAGTMRASRYGRERGYLEQANARICVLAQIESRRGLAHIGDIAAVQGIDAVYFGPNDMAADHGWLGQPGREENVAAIEAATAQVRACGKAAGILCGEHERERYQRAGIRIFAFASDASLLVRAADAMVAKHRAEPADPASEGVAR